MNKKGFTLIEVLAVIAILAVLMLIAVPVYQVVMENVNQSAYDTKIKKVLASAESYAEETGSFVFDIRTLIINGKLEADNEAGEYKDPRNKRDMKCDIINVMVENQQYYANITESSICYDLEELESLFGMAELVLFRDGSKINEVDSWVTGKEIEVRYQLKSNYQDYASYIEEITWSGEEMKTCTKENLMECAGYKIITEEIKTVNVTLNLKVVKDGIEIRNQVQKAISVDNQAPYVIEGSIIQNNDVNTSSQRKVEFDLSDGSGSGIKEYAILSSNDCNSNEYNTRKKTTNVPHITEYLNNGTYYICVEDKMGNRTSTSTTSFTVSHIDASKPIINSFSISSKQSGYQSLETRLNMKASDDGGVSNLKMCISNTGYLVGCKWENYQEGKDWTLNGTLDGKKRVVYLSIQDAAGNITQRVAEYTPYQECSKTSNVNYTAWSTCSVTCGGGTQTRTYQNKDNYTGKVCATKTESKTCNTHSCDPVVSMDPNDYESSKKVACDKDHFKRLITENMAKFKTSLDYQNFRNALYDCASVTEGILVGSDEAYSILRSHSRTSIVVGRGKTASCTCYGQKDSNSAIKNCEKPACQEDHDQFVSGIIYGGKIFVLSATTTKAISSSYDDDGFGYWYDSGNTWDKDGDSSFLIGSSSRVYEPGGFGYCTKTNNAIINEKKCPRARDERYNRIGYFIQGLRVGLIRRAWYYYDNYKNDRDIHNYYNGDVYVQIFKI